MRALMVGLMAVGLSGCTFGIATCDKGCPAGSQCDESTNLCFVPDGSTGGGTTTGGGSGGGMTGGGTGGGGGGGGGTATPECTPAVKESCAGWQECIPTESGGVCEDADYELTWLTPAEGQPSRMTSVTGTVTVAKRDGGAVLLTTLPVSGTAEFVGSNGNYTGSLPLGGADGVKTFVAGWEDGGPFEPRTVVYDTAAPEVTLSAEARPTTLPDGEQGFTGHWKKDEWAVVVVRVDAGLPATAANITTSWDGGVRPASSGCPTSCTGTCRCFEVDLSGSTLNDFRDAVAFRVEGVADEAGNVAGVASSTINVTRFKWARTLELQGDMTSLQPVSVAANGAVVWAGRNTNGFGSRYAFTSTSQDGGTNWREAADGSVTAGPVLGESAVFFASTVVTGGLSQAPLATGSLQDPLTRPCGGGAAFSGDMALSRIGAQDIPLAVRRDGVSDGEIAAVVNGSCRSYVLNPAPGNPNARPTMVALSRDGGTEAFVAYQNGGNLWKATLAGASWAANGTTALPSGVQPLGLFQDGLAFVGGGGVAGNGSFFSVPSGGTLPATVSSSVSASNAGPAAIGVGYLVYGTDTGVLRRDVYMAGNLVDGGVSLSGTGLGDLQSTTPIIGEGELVYFAGLDGVVSVRRATDLSEVWRYSPGGGTAVAQPALDVYRGTNGAKDCSKPLGVYYQLVRSGTTATLRAILVDSRGLDENAPWPKYQRDNANTGNSSFSLTPWSCE